MTNEDEILKTDEMIRQMEQFLEKASTIRVGKGDIRCQASISSASEQVEAILETARKFRAWLKINDMIVKMRKPLTVLAGHLEVEAARELVELTVKLQQFGETEICPWKDLEHLLKMGEQ
jgi:hypothetical protein